MAESRPRPLPTADLRERRAIDWRSIVTAVALAVALSSVVSALTIVVVGNGNQTTQRQIAEATYAAAVRNCERIAVGDQAQNTLTYAVYAFLKSDSDLVLTQLSLSAKIGQGKVLHPFNLSARQIAFATALTKAQQAYADYWSRELAPLVKALPQAPNCADRIPVPKGLKRVSPQRLPPAPPLPPLPSVKLPR